MSNPVRIQVRCTGEVREQWEEVRGQFDMTHAEFAEAVAGFVQEHEAEFRRYNGSETRTGGSAEEERRE